MNGTQNINATVECIKGTNSFTGTNYVNVCTGSESFVPNGSVDYVLLALFGFMVFAIARMFYNLNH